MKMILLVRVLQEADPKMGLISAVFYQEKHLSETTEEPVNAGRASRWRRQSDGQEKRFVSGMSGPCLAISVKWSKALGDSLSHTGHQRSPCVPRMACLSVPPVTSHCLGTAPGKQGPCTDTAMDFRAQEWGPGGSPGGCDPNLPTEGPGPLELKPFSDSLALRVLSQLQGTRGNHKVPRSITQVPTYSSHPHHVTAVPHLLWIRVLYSWLKKRGLIFSPACP